MVRFGKYSPNNPEYLGAGCGILGLGEYEEKRRYYDEQRKLEYKEYLTQQALQLPAKGKVDKTKKPVIDEKDNFVESHRHTGAIQKHVSTQTERDFKDVSTNTESNEKYNKVERSKQSHLPKGDTHNSRISSPIPRNVTNYETNNFNGLSSLGGKFPPPEELLLKSSPDLARRGVFNDFFNQDLKDSATLITQAKTARRRWRDNASSYEKDLRAQVEERQRLKRELQEKEKREEIERDRWVMEEGERTLSRQKEEEEKTKAREDLNKKRMEDFFHRQEELKKEAKEIRHAELTRRMLESQSSAPGIDPYMGRKNQSPEEMLMNQPLQGQAISPLKSPLIPVQESDMFRNLSSPRIKGSKTTCTATQIDKASQLEDKWSLSPVKRIESNQVSTKTPLSARDHQSISARRNISKPFSAQVPKTSRPSDMKFAKSTSLTNNLEKGENAIERIEEKLPADHHIFANLSEIRKQLKFEQMRMEEAIKRHNMEMSSKKDSPSN